LDLHVQESKGLVWRYSKRQDRKWYRRHGYGADSYRRYWHRGDGNGHTRCRVNWLAWDTLHIDQQFRVVDIE
jgi:hypothetical protein